MVVAMHFDHFAIHHAFPAKLHSAFRITCATEKQNYRNNTEEWIKVKKHNTHELQPQRHCLFIVCIDTTKLLQKMWSQSSSLSYNEDTSAQKETRTKNTCCSRGVLDHRLITSWTHFVAVPECTSRKMSKNVGKCQIIKWSKMIKESKSEQYEEKYPQLLPRDLEASF